MRLLRIALLCSLPTAHLHGMISYSMPKSDVAAYPQVQMACQKILKGIENAHTEQQLFSELQRLHTLDVGKLSNPFLFLAKLSQTNALKQASLPIKTYYTHQLYMLSMKIFYAQASKKQYITPSEKKEVIENLNVLCTQADLQATSEIQHNVAATIAFIKDLPQNELSLRNAEILYQLLAILLRKKNTTKKELEIILQTQLGIEHTHVATYLVLLELLKIHYIQKADQQAFLTITAFINLPELPPIVQYKMQKTLGEIFRTLMDKGKQYEAYYFIDQLLPFIPKLLTPLSVPDPLGDEDNRLLAQGLLIQWCLISPYLYVLFDIPNLSPQELESKIQEKINEKDLQAWLPTCKEQLDELGLLTPPQQAPLNVLQQVLLHATYFQALNFILAQEKQTFDTEETPKKTSTPSTLANEKDSATLNLLNESVHKIEAQVQTMLEELKHFQKLQQDQGKNLQIIKKNTRAAEKKESSKLLSNYTWLYPPYIWLITVGLLLMLILVCALLILTLRRKRS